MGFLIRIFTSNLPPLAFLPSIIFARKKLFENRKKNFLEGKKLTSNESWISHVVSNGCSLTVATPINVSERKKPLKKSGITSQQFHKQDLVVSSFLYFMVNFTMWEWYTNVSVSQTRRRRKWLYRYNVDGSVNKSRSQVFIYRHRAIYVEMDNQNPTDP